jgi:outer membrane lipoprotein-sorting protein
MMRIFGCFLAAMAVLISHTQAQTSDDEVRRVIEKVRANYSGLTVWQFEHNISIEEVVSGASPVKVVDVNLITANQGPAASLGLNRAMCAGLCRLEWSTAARGRVVLVRDGQATWLYSSARNEFVKGPALRDVASSVSGPMLLSVHVFPLMSFDEQQWTKAVLLESQTIDVGGEQRECYVVEALLKSQGMSISTPGTRPAPDEFAAFTPSGYLGVLGLQALSSLIAPPATLSGAYIAPAAGTAPPRALFWIDKERSLVLRRTITQSARKITPTMQSLDSAPAVELRLTDRFSLAKTGSDVPETMFRFETPAGAKEVSRQ